MVNPIKGGRHHHLNHPISYNMLVGQNSHHGRPYEFYISLCRFSESTFVLSVVQKFCQISTSTLHVFALRSLPSIWISLRYFEMKLKWNHFPLTHRLKLKMLTSPMRNNIPTTKNKIQFILVLINTTQPSQGQSVSLSTLLSNALMCAGCCGTIFIVNCFLFCCHMVLTSSY